jgi:beta-galactosidase
LEEEEAVKPLSVHDGLLWQGEEPVLWRSATVQYFRLAPAEWRDRLRKVRQAGFHAAEVYVPWNFHEIEPGHLDFTHGPRDLVGFLRACQEEGLAVVLRPGPYICAEYEGGGLPARLSLLPPGYLREDREPYLSEALAYWRSVLSAVRPLLQDQGGPVVLLQVENELDFYPAQNAQAMVRRLVQEARRLGVTVPLFTCAGHRLEESGGFVEGILPGINVKPPPQGPWHQRLRHMGEKLRAQGKTLLVVETYRDAAVLRRLVGIGAKWLGPYMVVGGVHFGPTAPSNNWDPIPALIMSDYDFQSPIAADGRLRPGYYALVELFSLLDVFAFFFARALPGKAPWPPPRPGVYIEALTWGQEQVLAVTEDEGQLLACDLPSPWGPLPLELEGKDTLLLPWGVHLPQGPAVWSTLEPVGWDPASRTLTLVGRPGQAGGVATQGYCFRGRVPARGQPPAEVAWGPLTLRLQVRQAPPRQETPQNPERNLPYPDDEEEPPALVTALPLKVYPLRFPTAWPYSGRGDPPSLEEASLLGQGEILYLFSVPPEAQGLELTGADVVSMYVQGRLVGTDLPGGLARTWPLLPGAQEVWVRVVSWGHSPFHDERLPSLRLGSRRGLTAPAYARFDHERQGTQEISPAPWVPWAPAAVSLPHALPLPCQAIAVLPDHGWLPDDAPLDEDALPKLLAQGRGVLLQGQLPWVSPGTRVHVCLEGEDLFLAVYAAGQLIGRSLLGPHLHPHMTGGALPPGEWVVPWGLWPAREGTILLQIRAWPTSHKAQLKLPVRLKVYPP